MPVRRTKTSACALGIALALSALTAQAAERRLDRTFEVAPGGKLTVEAGGTDIVVQATDSNQVAVHVLLKGAQRTLDRMELSAEQSGQDVSVIVKQHGYLGDWLWFGYREGRIQVDVPRRYNLDLKTSGGDLSVTGVEGEALGKTSGGDVRVADIRGPVNMRTSGGDVHVDRIEGDTRLHTSGGDVDVNHVNGALDAATSGGYIHLQDIGGPVVANTSSGDVVATGIRGDADLGTSGGDIRAVVDGKIAAHTSGGSVVAELVGQNRGISASSSGGDIIVRVPKDVTATFSASTSGGSVRTELPITTTEVADRKLSGTLNGGGNTIQARTSGGDIRLQARN